MGWFNHQLEKDGLEPVPSIFQRLWHQTSVFFVSPWVYSANDIFCWFWVFDDGIPQIICPFIRGIPGISNQQPKQTDQNPVVDLRFFSKTSSAGSLDSWAFFWKRQAELKELKLWRTCAMRVTFYGLLNEGRYTLEDERLEPTAITIFHKENDGKNWTNFYGSCERKTFQVFFFLPNFFSIIDTPIQTKNKILNP